VFSRYFSKGFFVNLIQPIVAQKNRRIETIYVTFFIAVQADHVLKRTNIKALLGKLSLQGPTVAISVSLLPAKSAARLIK